MSHYLSRYTLDLYDVRTLNIKDIYSIHKIVFDLYDDKRNGDRAESSGIIFVDQGFHDNKRIIDILSDRKPHEVQIGTLDTRILNESFYNADVFNFEVAIHPVKRRDSIEIPIKGEQAILEWFLQKSGQWGFQVEKNVTFLKSLRIEKFSTAKKKMTISIAVIHGVLRVTNKEKFLKSVFGGIGRGKAFGCGLLQVIPM